ncbi:hypothetical protein SDC9_159910 [bioreactor metagenome]|uniref:Uncharacterized protein n=1 Tax=bioreactor metagenome TaxID=1076179 RepID=A0A645FGH8_9ZZZZ
MLPDIQQIKRAAVKGVEIPAVVRRPKFHLLDGVFIFVHRTDGANGCHWAAIPSFIDHDAVFRRHPDKTHLRILIHIKHFKAAAGNAAGLGHLGIFVLLIVIIENILHSSQKGIVLGRVHHGLADKIPDGRIRDVLGHIVDNTVIRGCAVPFREMENVVVAHIVILQLCVFGEAFVFLNNILDVGFRQAFDGRPLHV